MVPDGMLWSRAPEDTEAMEVRVFRPTLVATNVSMQSRHNTDARVQYVDIS
jgi:hypothetical protein